MSRGRGATAVAVLAAIAAVGAERRPALLPPPPGYVEGPPPGHTGGFGEPTCQQCHFDAPLNEPDGALRLDGVPDSYAPGATYRLQVRLDPPELRRTGFQMAVRFERGERASSQAGSLQSLDERTQVIDSAGVQYLQQTRQGSEVGAAAAASWTLEWTAPEAEESVVFHVAANAANDDASEFGDRIYTTSLGSAPADEASEAERRR